jgi:hypothetical protein
MSYFQGKLGAAEGNTQVRYTAEVVHHLGMETAERFGRLVDEEVQEEAVHFQEEGSPGNP